MLTLPLQNVESEDMKPLALSLTVAQWVELLNSDRAKRGQKALNYLDGLQEEEMINLLSDPAAGRTKWRSRGLFPRYRNLTKMIVSKSTQLFKDEMPKQEIFPMGSQVRDDIQTQRFNDELAKVEFQEFCINLDELVRLLKTAIVLVQYDKAQKQLVFDVLHRGNCQIIIDPATKQALGLIHRTSDLSMNQTYRVWTWDEIYDIAQQTTGSGATTKVELVVTNTQDNIYKCIPIAPFYDTNYPRSGFWVEAPNDLIALNEMYNLHITDAEYAILWNKMSTLFTNMRPVDGGEPQLEIAELPMVALPRQVPSIPQVQAGPGQAVLLDTTGVDAPYLKYENPKIDLKPLNDVVDDWVQAYSIDWSVRIHSSADGRVTSGFQLVVEEMPNLELRKTRGKMFAAGFKRLYRVIATVMNTVNSQIVFDPQAELFTTFNEPTLPTDLMEQEQVWDAKIAGNRATELDYFEQVCGMSPDEAEAKWNEIVAWNKQKAQQLALTRDPLQSETNDADSNPGEEVDKSASGIADDPEGNIEANPVTGIDQITKAVPDDNQASVGSTSVI